MLRYRLLVVCSKCTLKESQHHIHSHKSIYSKKKKKNPQLKSFPHITAKSSVEINSLPVRFLTFKCLLIVITAHLDPMCKSKRDFVAGIKKRWHGCSVILLIIAQQSNHEEMETNSTLFLFLFFFSTLFSL